jgi:hypothetical protein
MTTARLTTFILGVAALVTPARASLTYYCTNGCGNPASDFATEATVTDGLVLTSLIDFTGTLSQFGTVANDEYIDSTTGVEFIAFNSNGTANETFSVSGGQLNTVADNGDTIEIILPADTYGVAVNFTTTFPSGETLCMDPSTATLSSCDSGGTHIASGGSGFVGTLNDNPTPATMTTIWLNPLNDGSADTNLTSFEIATQASESEAPDAATGLTLGTGLVLISLLHRRTRSLRSRQR